MGGLSIALGYKARLGAWFIVLFLLPVTFTIHAFWSVQDPMAAMMGTALLVAYFGSGPLSVDAWIKFGHRLPQIFNKEVNV